MVRLHPGTRAGQRRWLGVGGLCAVTLVAISLGGLPGLLIGGLVAVSWRRLPPEYTFTLGQFALVMLMPDGPALTDGIDGRQVMLGIGELGLLAVLVTPAPADSAPRPRTTALLAGVATLSAGAGWLSVGWLDAIWVAVLGGAGLAAAIALGIREYEYWALDTPSQERAHDHD